VANQFPDWELVIAGPLDSNYARRVESETRQSAAPRVSFVGGIFGEEKSALLHSARLFVLPSYSENFGNVVAEAFAHGTPVITTNATPWTDLDARGCGWSIAPNVEALSAALREAMSLPDEALDAMGLRGREWMASMFSWTNIVVDFEALYEWLSGTGTRPRFLQT
jgi:glycosyltransferase involved in cell wall biosynthesis